MSQFITTTPLMNMRPVGSAADRSLPRIEGILEKEFKGRLSLRLAEPVERNDKTGVDWYIDSDDDVTQLTTIPEELADYYKRRLQADVSGVEKAAGHYESRNDQASLTTAAALRNAIRYPSDENIWLVGDVPSGKAAIVLTAWGYEAQRPELSGGRGDAIKRPVKVLPDSGEVHIGPGEPVTPLVVPSKPTTKNWLGILSSVLWALALVLPFVIGWFLLPACGIRVPFTDRYVYGWGDGAFCRQLPNPQVEAGRKQSSMLAAELGGLTEQVRAKVESCVPPLPEPEPDPMEEAKERVEEAGGVWNQNETMVSLIWNNQNDLDLAVVCPNGSKVSESGPACGGRLEIDRNYRENIDHPVEHIRFDGSSLMPGSYQVEVRYWQNKVPSQLKTPFKVIVQQEGKPPIISSDDAREVRKVIKVTEFTVP